MNFLVLFLFVALTIIVVPILIDLVGNSFSVRFRKQIQNSLGTEK
jgi:hypothetical protein